MGLAYWRKRLEDWWRWFRLCGSVDGQTGGRCIKKRRHGSPLHTDGRNAWYDDEAKPVTHGHVRVPENGRRR
jgi:hypothetical protein